MLNNKDRLKGYALGLLLSIATIALMTLASLAGINRQPTSMINYESYEILELNK